MNDILDLLKTKLEGLVTGLTFDDQTNPGTPVGVTVHKLFLPVRSDSHQEGEEQPFLLIRRHRFVADVKPDRITIQVTGSIYTAGDYSDGDDDISRLCEAVMKITGSRGMNPYRLSTPADGWFGEKESGAQAHPYYEFTLNLTFIAPSGRRI